MPALDEVTFMQFEDSNYGEGIVLQEYNGEWSLVNANRGEQDVVYLRWAYPQGRGKNAGPIEKSLPWKITIGKDKAQAIETLTWFLRALKGGDKEPAPAPKPEPEIPF